MNVTQIVYSTADLVRSRIFSNVQFLYDIVWLATGWAKICLQSIVIIPFGLLLDVCGDLLRLSWTLACVGILVISISFIKSLKPRYNFHHETPAKSITLSGGGSSSSRSTDHRNEVFSPSTSRETKSTSSGWPIKRYIERKFPLALGLWSRLRAESRDINQICRPALSEPDIEAVHKQLSWAHTQVDIESVNWINQTLRTLWPSIRALLNIFLFNELLKPKKAGVKNLASESRKLSKQKPKLSVYISSRRKLDLIRQIEANALTRYQSLVDRSIFRVTFYVVKLAIVYMKQFVLDYLCYLFKGVRTKSKESEGEDDDDVGKRFDVNLEELIKTKKRVESMKVDQAKTATKSWNGYDITSDNRSKSENLKTKRERRLISAPPRTSAKTMISNGLLGPRGMAKLREKRLKLADRFRKAYEKSREKNELTIERIQLGDSIPMINGLKYIDERDDLVIDPVRTSRHLAGSDEGNMRFVGELSYASDENFQIKLSIHPSIGQIRLLNFKLQLRCYLTLNHTVNELNRDLKIFDTPDDVLFPAINYVQLSLVDVPNFDWKLDRPGRWRPYNVDKEKKSSFLHRMSEHMSRLFDPVDVINHSYFKYIVHSIVHISLRWFQPFDIRIGPHVYLKTMC